MCGSAKVFLKGLTLATAKTLRHINYFI